MKKLLYIVAAMIITVSALASGNEDTPETAAELTAHNDTARLESDTTTAADVPAERSRRHRYVSPVNNAATRTQYVNDAAGDSARMLERRRLRSIHYHDEMGNTVMVDTVTGEEWVDSTMIPPPPKMKQPLLYAAEIGVNVWDPIMRIFGQKYGGIDFSAALNLHNRYIPTFEAGLGLAKKTPPNMNFTYSSPISPYFKIGADYNFIYNSDPDYRFVAGVRYGFSSFKYTIENATFDDNYWGETGIIKFPSQNVTAGWFEIGIGLRVKIAGPISAGWMIKYHSILHQTKPTTGNAWYIPGFGSSTSTITGAFSIVYNLQLDRKHRTELDAATEISQ